MPLNANDITDLYDRHAEALLAFLVRRTWDAEAAVDILAESFAAAFEARQQFRGDDEEGAGAWLYSIARHQLADYFRRQRVQAEPELALDPAEEVFVPLDAELGV